MNGKENRKGTKMSKGALDGEISFERRLCKVDDEYGHFHMWEQYSKPLEASPFIGGAPAGVFSKVYGIVEFADGMRRVDPTDIRFVDDENKYLKILNERMKGE